METQKQKEIINGYVMGDGFFTEGGSLQVEQGKNQLKFVEWMFEQLKSLCDPECEISRVPQKGTLRSYRFYTRRLFQTDRDAWYKKEVVNQSTGETKRIKQLPKDFDDRFTPLFITVWFACDGTKIPTHRGAKFEVTCFTPEERATLKDLFKKKYGIETSINKAGFSCKRTQQYTLNIAAKSYDTFYKLVTRDTSLLLDLFSYKLHKRPDNVS